MNEMKKLNIVHEIHYLIHQMQYFINSMNWESAYT